MLVGLLGLFVFFGARFVHLKWNLQTHRSGAFMRNTGLLLTLLGSMLFVIPLIGLILLSTTPLESEQIGYLIYWVVLPIPLGTALLPWGIVLWLSGEQSKFLPKRRFSTFQPLPRYGLRLTMIALAVMSLGLLLVYRPLWQFTQSTLPSQLLGIVLLMIGCLLGVFGVLWWIIGENRAARMRLREPALFPRQPAVL